MIIENIVCMIVGILIGYAAMYVAGYKLPRIKELRNDDCERRIRSIHEELRKTKHALWIARTERAFAERRMYCAKAAFCHIENDDLRIKWCEIQRKCFKKAEEFK